MGVRKLSLTLIPFALAGLAAACSVLPSGGPSSYRLRASAGAGGGALAHELVPLSAPVVAVLARQQASSFAPIFSDERSPQEVRLGTGDVVSITVFEAASGGLFIPSDSVTRQGNFVHLPRQAVDRNGDVTVPFAGAVRAAGRTVAEVQAAIRSRLENRAIEPQVILAVEEQRSAQVSVLGEVNAPARLAANPGGERILDAIARAGGPKWPAHESLVTLQRRGRRATLPFDAIVADPANNIPVRPGDTLYVHREEQSFVALGASGRNAEVSFGADRLTLAEAVAKAGGLVDERADPSAVFLFRLEDRGTIEAFGIGTARWGGAAWIPTVYRVDLRDPNSVFLAQLMPMRDKDVLLVANAPAVGLGKALRLLRLGFAGLGEGPLP